LLLYYFKEKRLYVKLLFSKKPAEASEYFHVTSFYGRPEEPVKAIFLRVDAFLRQTIRSFTGKRIVEATPVYKLPAMISDIERI
jgi:hypothetical protein